MEEKLKTLTQLQSTQTPSVTPILYNYTDSNRVMTQVFLTSPDDAVILSFTRPWNGNTDVSTRGSGTTHAVRT